MYRHRVSNWWWRDVPGYEGAYRVSRGGAVYSMKRMIPWNGTYTTIGGKFLTPVRGRGSDIKASYHVVLYSEGKRETRSVGRLVWTAFNGPLDEKVLVRHTDGDPSNNKLSNLYVEGE